MQGLCESVVECILMRVALMLLGLESNVQMEKGSRIFVMLVARYIVGSERGSLTSSNSTQSI